MKTDCGDCKAKHVCPSFVDPGSLLCGINRAQAAGTHADAMPHIIPNPEETLSCDGCRYETKQVNEMPCCNCIRCPKADHYEPED